MGTGTAGSEPPTWLSWPLVAMAGSPREGQPCPRAVKGTYCLLKLALVALDLALQLVNQVLHPGQVLPVFLSLQEPQLP